MIRSCALLADHMNIQEGTASNHKAMLNLKNIEPGIKLLKLNWLAEGVKPHIGLVRDISLYHTIFLSLWDTTPGDNLVLIFYLHIHVFIKVRKSNRFSFCVTFIGIVSGKTPQGLSHPIWKLLGWDGQQRVCIRFNGVYFCCGLILARTKPQKTLIGT